MCVLNNLWKTHQRAICILTAYIGIVFIFISIGLLYLNAGNLNIIIIAFFDFGFLIALISLILFLTSKFEKNFWLYFYVTILILVFAFGIPTIFMNLISPKGIQKLLEAYITINLAILSFTFAGIAINKDILPIFKNEAPEVFKNFQNFIILTAFTLIMTVFIYCLSFINSSNNALMSIEICGSNVQIISLFFWFITVFTFISIMNIMYYTWIISNSIGDDKVKKE